MTVEKATCVGGVFVREYSSLSQTDDSVEDKSPFVCSVTR